MNVAAIVFALATVAFLVSIKFLVLRLYRSKRAIELKCVVLESEKLTLETQVNDLFKRTMELIGERDGALHDLEGTRLERDATQAQLCVCSEQLGVYERDTKPYRNECTNLEHRLSLAVVSLTRIEEAIHATDHLKTTIEGRELLVLVLEKLEGLLRGHRNGDYGLAKNRLEQARRELEYAIARRRPRKVS